MVPEIGVAGAGDVDCDTDGCEGEEEEVDWWGGGLGAEWGLVL